MVSPITPKDVMTCFKEQVEESVTKFISSEPMITQGEIEYLHHYSLTIFHKFTPQNSIVFAKDSYDEKRVKILVYLYFHRSHLKDIYSRETCAFCNQLSIYVKGLDGKLHRFKYLSRASSYLGVDLISMAIDFKSVPSAVDSFYQFDTIRSPNVHDYSKVVYCIVIHLLPTDRTSGLYKSYYYIGMTDQTIYQKMSLHFASAKKVSNIIEAQENQGPETTGNILKEVKSDPDILLIDCALVLAHLENYPIKIYLIDEAASMESLRVARKNWTDLLKSQDNGFNAS